MQNGHFVLLLGLFIVGNGVFMLWKRYKLDKECTAQATGTVSEIYSRGGKSRSYHMKFKYSAKDVEYTQSAKIGLLGYFSKGPGDSVTVFYDPSSPQRSYALEGKISIFSALFLIAFGAIAVVGGVLMLGDATIQLPFLLRRRAF